MAGNTFGQLFRVTTWGESHGLALGVVIDGCPAGLKISQREIQKELDRRRPGQSQLTTQRQEKDQVEILSGISEGQTLGTPISMLIRNTDARSRDYSKLKAKFRSGHADQVYQEKYGIRDWRGGGRASGRETVARVAAGVIAKKILLPCEIIGHTKQVGRIKARKFNLGQIEKNPVRCADPEIAKEMIKLILKTKEEDNSIGGIIEIIVKEPLKGLGEPVFDKLKADLAKGLLSIGAVMGFEYGPGFSVAELTGKENNQIDPGILGGISTGQEIIIRIVIKPTSSIQVGGRHDPCLCPRIVPAAEAMVALVLTDHFLRNKTAKI